MTEKQKHPFILDEKDLPQEIDHALGIIRIDGEKKRYYGVSIREKHDKPTKKGTTYSTTQRSSVILLDNGELYSETHQPEGAKFTYKTKMGITSHEFSVKAISSYINKTYDPVEVTPTSVYNDFKITYDEHLVFEQREAYEFNALWDCLTYFHDLVDTFLVIKHEGVSGAAKSKGASASARQSFNGRSFLCPTPASFFRYRNNNRSMLAFEEAEKLFADKQNRDDSALLEYLNGSYEKGHPVPRQNDKDLNVTEEFDAAGFTRICSIKPLKGALRKRSVTISMIKARPGDPRADKELPIRESNYFSKKRDKAYIMGLLHWRAYEQSLRTTTNTYEVANREWALIKPVVAFAKLINDDLAQRVGNYLSQLFIVRDEPISEDSWEYHLIKIVIQKFAYFDAEEGFIASKEISNAWNQSIGKDVSTKATTSKLNALGFEKFHGHNRSKTERGFTASFWGVIDVLLRNDNITIEKVLIFVSEVSNCPITVDKVRVWYSDTFRTHGHIKDKFLDTSDGWTDYLGVGYEKKELSDAPVNESLNRDQKLLKSVVSLINQSPSKLVKHSELIKMNPHISDELITQWCEQGYLYKPKPDLLGVLE